MFHSLLSQTGRRDARAWRLFAAAWLGLIANPVDANEWVRYQRTATFMGTNWYVALYSQDIDSANRAFERAWAVIDEIDRDLSNYRGDSELNRLCRAAPHPHPIPVKNHLWCVLRAADRISRETGGAFDVTIGPLTKLWRRARLQKRLPDAERIAETRERVGYQMVRYDTQRQAIQLTKAGMQLDLGGIAKGYAVDQAMAAIRQVGIDRALVNGGGDLAVGAAPPNSTGWRIAIASLAPQSPADYLILADAAVATSGDAWQFLEIDGKRYSHIVDPQTGMGSTRRSTVSVLAPTCMRADGWASALSVLPRDQGLRLIRNEPKLEAMLITVDEDNQPIRRETNGFRP